MTTIAFDGVSICADTLVSSDGVRMGHAEKIIKTKNGVVACSGDMATCAKIVDWIGKGASKKRLPALTSDEDFNVLWIDKKKRAWHIETSLVPFRACVPCAEGSGSDFALAAMTAGMNARKAVELAIKLDCYSGGEIQEVKICI